MKREPVTHERARNLFDYDWEAGALIWMPRPQSDFRSVTAYKTYHKRFAGRQAGYVDSQGYVSIFADYRLYGAHRLIWLHLYGYMPVEIDHIDGNRSNNVRANLREVTTAINARNQSIDKRNTSGVTGVVWNKKCGKWQASIRTEGKLHYLGLFESVEEAAEIRKAEEIRLGFHRNHGSPCRPRYIEAA